MTTFIEINPTNSTIKAGLTTTSGATLTFNRSGMTYTDESNTAHAVLQSGDVPISLISGALLSGAALTSGHIADNSGYVTSVSGALLSGESYTTSAYATATSALAIGTSGFALATSGIASSISADAVLTSAVALLDTSKQVSGVYVASGGGTYWCVSGYAQASGAYMNSGVYLESGAGSMYVVSGWAQASGAYQLSGSGVGDLLSGSVSQYAMSGEMSANAVSGTCAASGAWTDLYQASGIYFQSGATAYFVGVAFNPACASIQLGGGELELINTSGYVLVQAMDDITTMTAGKNRNVINASGVLNCYDQQANPATVHRHWDMYVKTPDATPLAVQTIPMSDNSAHSIEVTVVAVQDNGAERAHWKLTALYYRDGGNATQQGSTVSISTIKSAGFGATDCVFGVNGGSWTLDLTGIADDVSWTASIDVVENLYA